MCTLFDCESKKDQQVKKLLTSELMPNKGLPTKSEKFQVGEFTLHSLPSETENENHHNNQYNYKDQ